MTNRLGWYIAAVTVAAAAGAAVRLADGLTPEQAAASVALAVGVVLAERSAARVPLRGQQFVFSSLEIVLALSLLHLSPGSMICGVGVGSAVAFRQLPRPKFVFNVSQMVLAVAVAVGVLPVAGVTGDPTAAAVWLAAAAGMFAFFVTNTALVCVALSLVSERPLRLVAPEVVPSSVVGWVVGTCAGLTIGMLVEVNPFASVLIVPLGLIAFAHYRGVVEQSREREQVEHLLGSTTRLQRSGDFDETLATVAEEAQALADATSAVTWVRVHDGDWLGLAVGVSGSVSQPTEGTRAFAAALADSAGPATSRTEGPLGQLVSLADVREAVGVRAHAPGVELLVVVADPTVSQRFFDEATIGRIRAFAAVAAVALANVAGHEAVRRALAHEQELSRRKDDFAASVSHELRTPLSATLGFLTMLANRPDMTEDRREMCVSSALSTAKRLSGLIDGILAAARLEQGASPATLEEADLGTVVASVAMEAVAGLGAGPHLRVADIAVPAVRTDAGKVHQILLNLVANAVKYAPDAPVTVSAALEGSKVVIRVRDAGSGIPAKDQELIFDRFHRCSDRVTPQEGLGLGLWLCRELARQLGGDVLLERSDSSGSIFALTLPLTTRHPSRHVSVPVADPRCQASLTSSAG